MAEQSGHQEYNNKEERVEGKVVDDAIFTRLEKVLQESVHAPAEEHGHLANAVFRLDDFSLWLENELKNSSPYTTLSELMERADRDDLEDAPEGQTTYYTSLASRGTASERFAVPFLEEYIAGGTEHERRESVPVPYIENVLRNLGILTHEQKLGDLQSVPAFAGSETQGRMGSSVYGLDTNISPGIKATVDFSPGNPCVGLEIAPSTVLINKSPFKEI
jgi:hypothetical protein